MNIIKVSQPTSVLIIKDTSTKEGKRKRLNMAQKTNGKMYEHKYIQNYKETEQGDDKNQKNV